MPRKRRRKYQLNNTRSDWRFWIAIAQLLREISDMILERAKPR